MPSDFLAVEFICLILALRRIHISSSIGCRRLDKLDRKQSNVTYVERRKMSLDNVRRQSDARCAPIWGSRPVLTPQGIPPRRHWDDKTDQSYRAMIHLARITNNISIPEHAHHGNRTLVFS